MGQRSRSNHQILLPIRNAAMILTPSNLAGTGSEIRASDMVMLANFGAAHAGEKALGLVRAGALHLNSPTRD
jgi:hypothetical protein